jgi:hypothetical protein
MVEHFSSRQKERGAVYKYFSPMESHRLTGDQWDPIYYEANQQLEAWGSETRWAWLDGTGWRKIPKEEWKKITEPQQNEFGVVCP